MVKGSKACEKAKCMTHYRLNTQREEENKLDEDNFTDLIICISNE